MTAKQVIKVLEFNIETAKNFLKFNKDTDKRQAALRVIYRAEVTGIIKGYEFAIDLLKK